MVERAFVEDVEDIGDTVPAEVAGALIAAAEYNRVYLSRHKPDLQVLLMQHDIRWARCVIAVRPDPSLPDGYEMSWIKGEDTFAWPGERTPGLLPSLHRTTAYLLPHRTDVDRMLMGYGDDPEIKAWRKDSVRARGRAWPAAMRAEVTPSGLAKRAEWRAWRHKHFGPNSAPVIFGMACPVPLRKLAPQGMIEPVSVPEEWQPTDRKIFSDRESEFNPPRAAGKVPAEPWPTSAEREWDIEWHKFSWEIPDAAYEGMRSWAVLVEAGDPKAVALAQASQIQVVDRYPPGKPDEIQDPDYVFFDISNAIHNGIHDDPEDTEASLDGACRRYRRRMEIGKDIIQQIFGSDPGEVIWLVTQHCYDDRGADRSELSWQQERFETRLRLGIATQRDHAIAALGDSYWE